MSTERQCLRNYELDTANPVGISGRVQRGVKGRTGRFCSLSPPPAFPAFSLLGCFPEDQRTPGRVPSLARGTVQGVLESRAEVLKQEAK